MKRYSPKALNQYRGASVSYSIDEIKTPLKKRLFELLYHPTSDIILFVMVMGSTGLLIMELNHPDTQHSAGWVASVAGKKTNPTWLILDIITTVFFAIEYFGKMWVSPYRALYFRNHLIELLALFPILRIFRMVRIIRALRLLRLVRLNQIIDNNISDQDDETSDLITVLMYLFFSIVFGTVGIMLFEKGNNDGFVHITDGLWWCIVTITTVGYGDISPITLPGKLVAGCIMFIGLAFYASLTGVVSETLVNKARRKKRKRMREQIFSQHVVICGWNQHAQSICETILKKEESLIVSINSHEKTYPSHSRFFRVHGDPCDVTFLEEAKIAKANHVIILADEQLASPQDQDARSILTAMNVTQYVVPQKVIFELKQVENRVHIQKMGIENILHLTTFLRSHIEDIVVGSHNSIEKYTPFPVQNTHIGKTFQEMIILLAQEADHHALGLYRNHSIQIPCPIQQEITVGDVILCAKK